jgi:glycosyltransferase involved in cell wall biosynthesis
MRVAHVSAAMGYGGAERVVVDLAASHAREGFEAAIIAPAGELDRDWEQLGVHRVLVPHARRGSLELIPVARAVAAAIRAWQPDVLHAHNVKATALTLTAARITSGRRPILSTMHGVSDRDIPASARILRHVDMVAVVSLAVREAVVARGLSPARVRVVHNGVDTVPALDAGTRRAYDREFGLAGDVVIAVGRLEPQKAHDRLLAAAALVLESRPDTRFLIVGEGELLDDLRRLASHLAIDHAVRFTGPREDAPQLIARADLLVFSSNWEGLSVAALEALAAGTPVVSTDVAGMRELLSTGAGEIVSGWEARDLAASIISTLSDRQRLEAMARTGRRLVSDQFSATSMRAAYAHLYRDVHERRPGFARA